MKTVLGETSSITLRSRLTKLVTLSSRNRNGSLLRPNAPVALGLARAPCVAELAYDASLDGRVFQHSAAGFSTTCSTGAGRCQRPAKPCHAGSDQPPSHPPPSPFRLPILLPVAAVETGSARRRAGASVDISRWFHHVGRFQPRQIREIRHYSPQEHDQHHADTNETKQI